MGGPTIVWWRGVRVDPRTATMLDEVARLVEPHLDPTQGSYSTSEEASAGTHNGGGAVDIDVLDSWSDDTITDVVRTMRTVGFAAWYRPPSKSWGSHIHAIAIGCPDLSTAARTQVVDYYAGRNGLRNRGPDTGPRLNPIPTWETYQEDDMPTAAELWRYRNDAIEQGDVFGLLVEAYRRAGDAEVAAEYANKQLRSIAGGVATVAKALADGKIDPAELRAVHDRLSGQA